MLCFKTYPSFSFNVIFLVFYILFTKYIKYDVVNAVKLFDMESATIKFTVTYHIPVL